MTLVSNNRKVIGILTDGDLRRCLNNEVELNETLIKDVMSSEFKGIACDALAIDAAEIMEKNKVDINILGQDISVMCTEEEKDILLKSRDRIVNEAEKVKSQTKNVGHDYFLILVLLNIAGSDIKNEMKIDELKSIEIELDNINRNLNESLK